MKWSWRIGTARGIEIRVHVTFILALLWGAIIWGSGGVTGVLYGMVLTVAVFSVVLLHELGHSLAAQRYGIPVQDIVLLPIGGVARLSRMPEKPGQELVVALAGPAVNLALIMVLAPVVLAGLVIQTATSGSLVLPSITTPGLMNFAAFLVMINVSLFLFNMLPAFPMDGGRVLRAGLAMRLPYAKATRAAVLVGRAFAVFFGIFGILSGNLLLALIALFVFSGAGAEGQAVSQRESLRGVKVSEVIDPHAPVLPANLPAYVAFDRLMRSPYPAVAVVDHNGEFVGFVSPADMQRRWADGVRGPVGAFVQKPSLVIQGHASLDAAHQEMAAAGAPIVAVYLGGRFMGLLDFATIGRVLAFRRRASAITGLDARPSPAAGEA